MYHYKDGTMHGMKEMQRMYIKAIFIKFITTKNKGILKKVTQIRHV